MQDILVNLPEFEGRIISFVKANAGAADDGNYCEFYIYFTDGSSMTIKAGNEMGWMTYEGGGHARKA